MCDSDALVCMGGPFAFARAVFVNRFGPPESVRDAAAQTRRHLVYANVIPVYANAVPVYTRGLPVYANVVPVYTRGLPVYMRGSFLWMRKA